ncbi:MAG: hypothetical protein AAF846_03845 [Chloroflexota bacterium]
MRAIGKFLWRFMVIFSFIVNIVLVAVLLIAGLYIFQIKAQVADPLIGGLHSTAAGLGDATIDWVIPVRDTVPVELTVPINSETILSPLTDTAGQTVPQEIPGETIVRLTRAVPIAITGANIDAGNLQLSNATVNITLPEGTELPVALDFNLLLDQELDIELDVRAVIPLQETQLNDPINQLGLLFEPLAIGLHNLPSNFSEAGTFAGEIVNNFGNLGEYLTAQLLATDGTGFNNQAYDPWLGFSQTAGVGYDDLIDEEFPADAQSQATGLVVPGGIPALDQLLPNRASLYDGDMTPAEINEAILNGFTAQAEGAPPRYTFDGTYADEYNRIQEENAQSAEAQTADPQIVPEGDGGTGGNPMQEDSSNTNDDGTGIIPTPSGN